MDRSSGFSGSGSGSGAPPGDSGVPTGSGLGGPSTPVTAHLAHLRQLRLAKDAMDRDWADPDLDLDAVAAHAGYSRYHFVRAFKAVYGETPGRYLSRRRTERAEELLRTANLSVTEICTLVGFSSLGTFSNRFKRQTGLTPSEYRRKYLGRGAALIPGCYALLWAGGFPQPQGDGGRPQGDGAGPGRPSNSE